MRRRVAPLSLFGSILAGATVALGALAMGCGGSDDPQGNIDGGGNDDATAVDASVDAFTPPANCDSLVKPTGAARYISHIPASEDFGFDNEGFLIGISLENGALVRTAYTPSTPETLVPGVAQSNFARGTRQLPGGDIVVAVNENNVVERYAANGSGTQIANINDPNGIVIGDDGMVYITAGSGSVSRVNPDTQEIITLHSSGTTYDGITLSPDGTKLYFNEEGGAVSVLEINAAGAVGTPQPLTQITVDFLLDGMTTDACGHIYIVEMAGKIWRYSNAGVLEEWVSPSSLTPQPGLIPAVNFGSGLGGWKRDSLYIMSFDGGVYEIDVGVNGRPTANL